MQKPFRLIVVALIIAGLLLLIAPQIVRAKYVGTAIPSLAPGDWSAGTPVNVNFTDNPFPGWMQLLTNPVKVNEAGQICHDFRGGQFGWVGEIRQLVDGQWVKVPVTVGWVPSTEGAFMICADVSSAGTYALFGFFNPPLSYYPDYVEPVVAPAPPSET